MKKRNYATFCDGHEEDIFYYKDLPHGCMLFATKSGVYFYNSVSKTLGVSGLKQEYFTIQMGFCDNPTAFPDMTFTNVYNIIHVYIDRRIERKFTVPGYGDGTVLVEPDATAEELAWAILNEMGVELEAIV